MRSLLPLLICGLMMAMCMVPMMRSHSRRANSTEEAAGNAEVEELRQQVRDLQARLDEQQAAADNGSA